MRDAILIASIASLLFTASISAVDIDADTDLVTKLKLAPTLLDQHKLLNDKQYVYDFTTNPMYSWNPGSVCNANIATFPTLTGTGMTVAQINLGPCAMLSPHLHRSINLVVAVSGMTHTYVIQENGARVVETFLTPGMMTMFPAASIHVMVNEGCDDNQLYSFLKSDDAGTLTVANALWQFGPDIGNRIMPMLNVSHDDWYVTGAQIPAIDKGATSGYEACLRKCGLNETEQQSGYARRGVVNV